MLTVVIPSATGNIANDTWKLQTLANSLPNSGGIISLPANEDYTINSPLLLKSNVTLEGNNCRLIAADALNNNIVRSHHIDLGNENITIRNLRIAGNQVNQSHVGNPQHAIAFYSSGGVLIEDCTIDDVELDGIYIGGQIGTTISGMVVGSFCSNVVTRNNTITNCYRNGISITNSRYTDVYSNNLSGNNKGATATPSRYDAGTIDLEPNDSSDHCFEINIYNNTVIHDQSSGIALQGSANKDHVNIYNNNIISTSDFGIVLFTPTTFLNIYDNTINTTNAGGIWVNSQGNVSTDLEIYGNVLDGNDAATFVGIGVNNIPDNVHIHDNTIQDYTRAVGVFINSVANITNNHFISCNTAIDKDGSSSYTESGNIIS